MLEPQIKLKNTVCCKGIFTCAGFSPGEGGSMTSGIVGEMKLQVLPSIPPVLTLILTATATMVYVIVLSTEGRRV